MLSSKKPLSQDWKKNFHNFWRDNLTPLWRAFPNLLKLRVLRDIESDCADNRLPLVRAIRFVSRNHIEEALAAPSRWESKETSKKLFEMFEGLVIHSVFRADQFDPFTAG